ncbi:MAG: 1-deoxy-D-xylulose-5-phosphate reductoisomerase [Oscillospiraceae bacterium]|jgi:1-deoxy-D-xylulose-5-phosphate reductoisomerase|nr:1-deoxy-D-xylulose-5-phosphate reductoisomerase [Oscillospiraceae bacterium]
MAGEVEHIALLGSTGSIGTQALDVIARHPGRFRVAALCAGRRADLLFEQARRFGPTRCGLLEEPDHIPDDLRGLDWVFGPDAASLCAAEPTATRVVHAVVGMAGLPAALSALSNGKRLLLANKESLVSGGALVMETAKSARGIIPIDSEHSAIFQCLEDARAKSIQPEKLVLTASGGPFRTWDAARIALAGPADALNHPVWRMGGKITVDSATMMNKALEVIEARWLFDMPGERIEVVVHPQGIIHSMVAFADGAVMAQLGLPDMRVPIAYAMAYPERIPTGVGVPEFGRLGGLTLEEPDPSRFPALRLGREALRAGGTAPAILNAANEEAVSAFLLERIRLGRILAVVESALAAIPQGAARSLEDVMEADRAAREFTRRSLER